MSTSIEEYQARFEDLKEFPWKKRLDEALAYFMPRTGKKRVSPKGHLVIGNGVGLSKEDQDWDRHLVVLCRPHWEHNISSREVIFRDLLDDSLDGLSIVEHGIEASYLSLSTVRNFVRDTLVNLAWSRGVRMFIKNYEYESVIHLAHRSEMSFVEGALLPSAEIPSIQAELELSFPPFASTFFRFKEDRYIQYWTKLLDDFYSTAIDGPFDGFSLFGQYLKGDPAPLTAEARHLFENRLFGGLRFVDHLGLYLQNVDEGHRLAYARPFRYWLARHFGFRQEGQQKFERTDKVSWADRLRTAVEEFSKGAFPAAHTVMPVQMMVDEYAELTGVLQEITMDLVKPNASP